MSAVSVATSRKYASMACHAPIGKPIKSNLSLPPGIKSAPTPMRTPPSVLLAMPRSVGHFSLNRRLRIRADKRLPISMHTETTVPAMGIERIEPTDVVIENQGANPARIGDAIPIAPIDSVNRRNLGLDLSDTPYLSARMPNSTKARTTGPSAEEALTGGSCGTRSKSESMLDTAKIPRNVKPKSISPFPRCPTDPNTQAPFTYVPMPNNMAAGTRYASGDQPSCIVGNVSSIA